MVTRKMLEQSVSQTKKQQVQEQHSALGMCLLHGQDLRQVHVSQRKDQTGNCAVVQCFTELSWYLITEELTTQLSTICQGREYATAGETLQTAVCLNIFRCLHC